MGILSGIYTITNIKNGKLYVGRSKDINRRWRQHKLDLNKGTHYNSYIQRAWNKDKEDNFLFQIIELVGKELIVEREQYWLDQLQPFKKNGYNLVEIAQGSSLFSKYYVLYYLNEEPILIYNLKEYCKNHNISASRLQNVLYNVTKYYKGYYIRYATPEEINEGVVIKDKDFVVECVLESTIENPFGFENLQEYGKKEYFIPNVGVFKNIEEALLVLKNRGLTLNVDSVAYNSSSIYKGVTFDKRRNRWKAIISHLGKKISIGRYLTQNEAAIAYNNKAIELKGSKAKLNVIIKDMLDLQITKKVGNSKYWVVFPPNKEAQLIYGLEHYAKENNLDPAAMIRVAQGERKQTKGYWIRQASEKEIIRKQVLDFNKPVFNYKAPNTNLPKYIKKYKESRFLVQITKEGKNMYGGIFNNLEEAIKQRDYYLTLSLQEITNIKTLNHAH